MFSVATRRAISVAVPLHRISAAAATTNSTTLLPSNMTIRLCSANSASVVSNSNETVNKLVATYPTAISIKSLVKRAVGILQQHGYTSNNTLLATSVCCDEANRVLEQEFAKIYGEHFSMGGLAGFPFGGNTSFNAMASHIPTNGHCLIVYGSHVGIDDEGVVGLLSRRGKTSSDACCGSGCAALSYVQNVMQGKIDPAPVPLDPIEVQQWFVGHLLLQHGERLEQAADPMVELPKALFDGQVDLIHKIVAKSGSAVSTGRIALLGGIQINTPPHMTDFFVPLKFELFSNQGHLLHDLMWEQEEHR